MKTECWKGCFKDRPAGHDGRVTDRGYNAYGG